MHSTLLNKPIGVIMSFLALLIFSVLALVRLPVSLLPDIESPSIIIRVNQPEMGVWEMEENILKPIRERMITVNHLRDLRSEASGGEGRIYLTFDFDAPMNLAYIEVNEKIDLLTNQLPRHVDRPHVVKVNSTDIPVLKVHLIPKNQEQFAELSEFAGKVIKKRFEQLDGVALVDINGLRGKEIRIVPDKQKLSALGLSPDAVIHALSVINRDISTVSIKEGQYRYFLKITSAFTGLQDIKNTAIPLANGQHVSLQEISSVEEVISSPRGLHVFNSEEGMVIHIHKRPSARLLSLRDDLYREVDQMKMEYTDFTFSTSSDQSLLLSLSIENLTQSLLYGGLFAFLILFLFMGNFRLSMIIGISLPVSLLISFLFFYLFNISLNIISLSGLALGIGMLIDNSIIVIDNISGKLSKGETLDRAVLLGTGEVMTALLSSVLTTLAVFVPLIFLSGISGALFYDQAMAIAIILGISLIVSFLLIPVLYKKLMGNRNPSLVKSDSKGFLFLRSHYDNFFRKVVKRPKTTLLILFVLLLLFYVGAGTLSMEGMPPVKKSEVELSIDWGEPITLEKNRERVHLLVKAIDNDLESYHADLGTLQYLLNTKKATIQTALLHLKAREGVSSDEIIQYLNTYMNQSFPQAEFELSPAKNTFDQIFTDEQPLVEIKLRTNGNGGLIEDQVIQQIIQSASGLGFQKGKGILLENSINLTLDFTLAGSYGIAVPDLINALQQQLGIYKITELKQFGEHTPLVLNNSNQSLQEVLTLGKVTNAQGVSYPLRTFVFPEYILKNKVIAADRKGIYQSLYSNNLPESHALENLKKFTGERGINMNIEGRFLSDREKIEELALVLSLSILLLYFILAAQFESLSQPLIVILTIPFGIGGAMGMLYLTGTSINIMSAIGMVIMLGIIVNDAILKIDTYNRLFEPGEIRSKGDYLRYLDQLIHEVGVLRLKPIIMTSLTTILAVLPITMMTGLGSDLQRPLAYTVIGGLSLGTLTAIFFIPLMYKALMGLQWRRYIPRNS